MSSGGKSTRGDALLLTCVAIAYRNQVRQPPGVIAPARLVKAPQSIPSIRRSLAQHGSDIEVSD